MKRTILVLMLPILFHGTGCAFFPKEVSLSRLEPVLEKSTELDGLEVDFVVEDTREDEGPCIGSGGLGFSGVTTEDNIAGWVGETIWSELVSAGCTKNSESPVTLQVRLKDIGTSIGFSSIGSRLNIGVKILAIEKTIFEEELESEISSFCFAETSSAHQSMLEEVISEWRREHMPTVIQVLQKHMSEIYPPGITILEPRDGIVVHKPEIKFAFRAKNAKQLKNLEFIINDKCENIPLKKALINISRTIKLKPGSNYLGVVGIPEDGKELSMKRLVKFIPYAPGDRKILAIGISSFKNIAGSYEGEKSAMEMEKLYTEALPEKSKANITRLSGKDAGFAGLFENIKDVFLKTGKDEYCICFYQGKVIKMKNDLFLAAKDTNPSKSMSALALTDITMEYMAQHFHGRRVLLVLIDEDLSVDAFRRLLKKATQQDKRLSILAISGKVNLKDALAFKADTKGDGHVSIKELMAYIKKQDVNVQLFGNVREDFIIR
jgi:hypothetical protein